MADPQNPLKVTGLALNGQQINIDDLKRFPLPSPDRVTITSQYQDYQPLEEVDLTDLSKVTHEIIGLRIRLHRIRIELRTAERMALKAKYVYEQEKKRTWIGISGGSDKSREAMAELICEESYSAYLVAQTVAKEITQHSRDIRTELDALKEISNNLRRQIDLQ